MFTLSRFARVRQPFDRLRPSFDKLRTVSLSNREQGRGDTRLD
jgi:hypothetical protein